MSKMMFTSYSQDEFKNEIRDVLEEVLGRKLGDSEIDFCDGDEEFSLGSLKARKEPKSKTPKEKYLTRGEVAKFLKISLPTLHRYTRDSILKSYRIGGKIRYKLVEVEEALKERNFGLPKKGGHHV